MKYFEGILKRYHPFEAGNQNEHEPQEQSHDENVNCMNLTQIDGTVDSHHSNKIATFEIIQTFAKKRHLPGM